METPKPPRICDGPVFLQERAESALHVKRWDFMQSSGISSMDQSMT